MKLPHTTAAAIFLKITSRKHMIRVPGWLGVCICCVQFLSRVLSILCVFSAASISSIRALRDWIFSP